MRLAERQPEQADAEIGIGECAGFGLSKRLGVCKPLLQQLLGNQPVGIANVRNPHPVRNARQAAGVGGQGARRDPVGQIGKAGKTIAHRIVQTDFAVKAQLGKQSGGEDFGDRADFKQRVLIRRGRAVPAQFAMALEKFIVRRDKRRHCAAMALAARLGNALAPVGGFQTVQSRPSFLRRVVGAGGVLFKRAQIAVNPLSTNKCVPLIKLASSLARNRAARPASSGSHIRPCAAALVNLIAGFGSDAQAADERWPAPFQS